MNRIFLEYKLTSPFPDPPERIEKALLPYLKSNESYNIFPTRSEIDGKIYYCVGIMKGKKDLRKPASGYVIVRDDSDHAVVPMREESIKPLYIHKDTDSIFRTLYSTGYRWSKRSIRICKWLVFTLNIADRALEKPLPPGVEESYQRFLSIASVIRDRQQTIVESIDEAQLLFAEMTTHHVINEHLYDRVWGCFLRTMNAVYDQHDIQIQTLEDRKMFLRHLFKAIRPWRFRLIYAYISLLKHHISLLASDSNKRDHREVGEFLSQDIPRLENSDTMEALLRNPRI
ncbi:hypothetical protein [Mechercharimyces sp. CAU 1602]|uniref:hypothetical protein n=1 Tax=Mechercharimyces sp. CAU 1602 TaxID=2973933 RepID=UPI00216136E1|nr:hypothetical protein [Mechercharimyces sp. CAU 1602]MCS1352436.1 hypothetical protein [Mechercharimyces sp. CAU 1602]